MKYKEISKKIVDLKHMLAKIHALEDTKDEIPWTREGVKEYNSLRDEHVTTTIVVIEALGRLARGDVVITQVVDGKKQ